MAEEVKEKKPRAPRKPKQPKEIIEPLVEITPEEEITLKEEVETLIEAAPKEEIVLTEEEFSKAKATEEEIIEILSNNQAPEVNREKLEESMKTAIEEVAKPEETPKKEEIKDLPERYAVTLRKLNPHLEDGKSKWAFELVKDQKHHTIFKGSYVRAYKWAENYCKVHGIASSKIQKIHK